MCPSGSLSPIVCSCSCLLSFVARFTLVVALARQTNRYVFFLLLWRAGNLKIPIFLKTDCLPPVGVLHGFANVAGRGPHQAVPDILPRSGAPLSLFLAGRKDGAGQPIRGRAFLPLHRYIIRFNSFETLLTNRFDVVVWVDPDVRETTNQSINSAYSERSCYRPCTLDYSLEPDIDPSLCVASLGDAASVGLVSEEEEEEEEGEDGLGDCVKNNETDEEETSEDAASSATTADQCQSILNPKDPSVLTNSNNNQVSSGAWTSHLHQWWPWRTLVLPLALFYLSYSSYDWTVIPLVA